MPTSSFFPRRAVRISLTLVCGALLASCSTSQWVTVARSGNPEQAARNLAEQRLRSYETNPQRLVNDVKAAKRNFDHLSAILRGEAGSRWGNHDARLPSRTQYVKYTQNYLSRAIVDFDKGTVTVETLDETQPETSLRNAIITTLLTPDDPRAVDLYSDKEIKLSGRPYLYDLVLNPQGRPIDNPSNAEAYARHLLEQRQQRTQPTEHGERRVSFVSFAMASDYLGKSAQRYAPLVDEFSQRYKISRSLVYGVIKTESAFNPFAVSAAPAYGLMQVVPTSAGRDVYRHLNGTDGIPSGDYLFDPRHNIEMGVAYLGLLQDEYLAGIDNPVAREYCIISAYNGGTGNVLHTFSADRSAAVHAINALPPSEVYSRLRFHHPRDESRRYLEKVLTARREFVSA